MTNFRAILAISIAFTIATAAMWGIALTWALEGATLPLAGAAAATLTVIATQCWLELRRARRDQDKTVLIKTLADSERDRRRELPRTLPLPIPFPFRRVP